MALESNIRAHTSNLLKQCSNVQQLFIRFCMRSWVFSFQASRPALSWVAEGALQAVGGCACSKSAQKTDFALSVKPASSQQSRVLLPWLLLLNFFALYSWIRLDERCCFKDLWTTSVKKTKNMIFQHFRDSELYVIDTQYSYFLESKNWWTN